MFGVQGLAMAGVDLFPSEQGWVNALIWIGAGLTVVFIYDVFYQKKHAIVHNFPLVGHLRYLLEKIGPELRQYWVANDKEERPFNRSERRWVYASSKGQNNNFGFGTDEQLYSTGYPILKQSAFPVTDAQATHFGKDPSAIPCAKVMGEFHGRAKPFRPPSVINISAMSFGSLGKNAISALNKGAVQAGCYHNTGEGGVSPYHQLGADLMWQLGTGYYGARSENGEFSMEKFLAQIERVPAIRCVEIKLSQGAKPGKGGILPAAKVTPEIAAIRGIPVGQACLSPNAHSAFSNIEELLDFIELIAKESGLPIGIKSAVGQQSFWDELGGAMKARGVGPDFIAIDGGEGGTGAAPLAFSDHVALPFKVGFARVYQSLQSAGVADRPLWIGSGKLGFPDRSVIGFSMGCDLIHVAREAMLAIGCIQAQRCHTGHCPAGVATHSAWFQRGLNVDEKALRFSRYVQTFRKEVMALTHACGYHHPCQFSADDVEVSTGVNQFTPLSKVLGYRPDPVNLEIGTQTRA
jgi:glutamate synthase domain-containing protein 2